MSKTSSLAAGRPTAAIHRIYDPRNVPVDAVISVAKRLQDFLYEHGGIPAGHPVPFPGLLDRAAND